MYPCVCVRVCVRVYTHTHTHTHTLMYTYTHITGQTRGAPPPPGHMRHTLRGVLRRLGVGGDEAGKRRRRRPRGHARDGDVVAHVPPERCVDHVVPEAEVRLS